VPVTTNSVPKKGWGLEMPAEHGAWGILVVPLVSAAGVAAKWNEPLALAAVCVLSLFLLRGSVEAQGRIRALLRPIHLALFSIALASSAFLFFHYHRRDLYFAALLAAALYLIQLGLVRRHKESSEERRSLGAELVGVGLLTLSAPVGWIAARGQLDRIGVQVWLLNLLFFLGGVLYVKYRVRGIRAHQAFARMGERVRFAWPVFMYHSVLVVILLVLIPLHLVLAAAVLAFIPGILRAGSLLFNLGRPFAIRRLGWSEIVHSAIFALLLTAVYRWS
jgi:YwiC-like protein